MQVLFVGPKTPQQMKEFAERQAMEAKRKASMKQLVKAAAGKPRQRVEKCASCKQRLDNHNQSACVSAQSKKVSASLNLMVIIIMLRPGCGLART